MIKYHNVMQNSIPLKLPEFLWSFLTEKKSLFACKMKMLPDQFDNYLIEASRLYKKYARAVFPLRAKKCEIFFGIFAHIFH